MNIFKPILNLADTVIDKVIADKDLAQQLKSQMAIAVINQMDNELKVAKDVIVAEAQGDSWLQRNWRPVTMLTFVGLIVAHWLGLTAPNLSEEQVLSLMSIVQVGIGGYVVGRSAEKVMKEYRRGN